MRRIGFSTGALALGDFRQGIELQRRDGVSAIELSALREDEVEELMAALPTLDLSQFKFRSFHAPSRVAKLTNRELVERLRPVADQGMPIVVHPDIIDDFEAWDSLGSSILLENMDQRKRVCRTAREMETYFARLPQAGFCLDIGHARQVDPTMSIAVDLLLRFQERLAEVHISEVNWACRHVAISSAAALAFWKVSAIIPEAIPIIIESLIPPEKIDNEVAIVRRCFRSDQPVFVDLASAEPTSTPCER